MIWKEIEGYKFPYRISDQGIVQKFHERKGWINISTFLYGGRFRVRLKGFDEKQKTIPIVSLMDKYFFDGYAKKNGLKIFHKNGSKADCSIENLEFLTQSEIGKKCGAFSKRKAVVKSKNGVDIEVYSSVKEAAKKNGLTRSSLSRRIKGKTLDEKGREFRYA